MDKGSLENKNKVASDNETNNISFSREQLARRNEIETLTNEDPQRAEKIGIIKKQYAKQRRNP